MVKTWSIVYGLIWASFFQIFLIVFLLTIESSDFWYSVIISFHIVLGVVVIGLGGFSFRLIRKTSCPDRIKRISKATAVLAGVQGVLGIILYALMHYNVSAIAQEIVLLLHVAIALAIISQASSTATSFDIWEEKEFLAPPKIS